MKNIKNIFSVIKMITEIAVVFSVILILGISLWTKTPVLELTNLDSQWWILFLCLITYTKINDKE